MREFPERIRCDAVVVSLDDTGSVMGDEAKRLDWVCGFKITHCAREAESLPVLLRFEKGVAAERIVVFSKEQIVNSRAKEVISELKVERVLILLPGDLLERFKESLEGLKEIIILEF